MKEKYLKPELEFIELEKVFTDEGFLPSLDPEHAGGDVTDPDKMYSYQNTDATNSSKENANQWEPETTEGDTKSSNSLDNLTDAFKQGAKEIISDVSNAITGSLEKIGQEELPTGGNSTNPIENSVSTQNESNESSSYGFLDEGQE